MQRCKNFFTMSQFFLSFHFNSLSSYYWCCKKKFCTLLLLQKCIFTVFVTDRYVSKICQRAPLIVGNTKLNGFFFDFDAI